MEHNRDRATTALLFFLSCTEQFNDLKVRIFPD